MIQIDCGIGRICGHCCQTEQHLIKCSKVNVCSSKEPYDSGSCFVVDCEGHVPETKCMNFHMLNECVLTRPLTQRGVCMNRLLEKDCDRGNLIEGLCKLRRPITKREKRLSYWFFSGLFLECFEERKCWGMSCSLLAWLHGGVDLIHSCHLASFAGWLTN